MPSEDPTFIVHVSGEKTSVKVLLGAVRRTAGPFLLVLGPESQLHLNDEEVSLFFTQSRALNVDRRLLVATKDERIMTIARAQGWQTVPSTNQLKLLLQSHPSLSKAIRAFSPVSWRRDIRSRLQFVGLLSLPKLRIWGLLVMSFVAFLYVFFKLLPSATIHIWSNQESGSFTTNVYLAESGAVLPVSADRVKLLRLKRLTVKIDRTITYDQISKNFTGTNAHMIVLVYNDSEEKYSLRKGTRLTNQAGMRFRLKYDLILDPHTKHEDEATADPIDQYNEVVGERGNVPAGIKWDFPGLSEKERGFVYARNEKAASGGATSYVNQLSKEDIEGTPQHPGAKQRLEQELLMVAKQQVEDERISDNNRLGTHYVQLVRDDLTKTVFENFQLSEDFIGQNITTIPISGSVEYTVILYDESELLSLMRAEILQRVPQDKMVVVNSLSKDNMDIHVIPPWNDDLLWVKITADLTYTQRYVLNPITPEGAKFGKYIRDNVSGKTISEANRIIKNLPEVSKVDIFVWPPWIYQLPELGSSIVIKEEDQ